MFFIHKESLKEFNDNKTLKIIKIFGDKYK